MSYYDCIFLSLIYEILSNVHIYDFGYMFLFICHYSQNLHCLFIYHNLNTPLISLLTVSLPQKIYQNFHTVV